MLSTPAEMASLSKLFVATWIRDCDEEHFAQSFARHPQVALQNARVEAVDLSEMRGLLLTGGPDIGAQFHNEPVSDPSVIDPDADPARDAWEFAALRAAHERGLPIFCVCKGTQLLNVALGGTLHLDIRGHNLPEQKFGDIQPLRVAPGARHRFERVNSSHHQAIDRVADVLEVEAWCADDEIVEQVRLRDYPWGLGVQYHPERGEIYAPLFADFVRQLRAD